MTEQEIQLLLGIGSLLATGLLFPFVLYFFKKNERLHEETKTKIGEHSVTLAGHEIRIVSLEEYRRFQQQGTQTPPTTVIHN